MSSVSPENEGLKKGEVNFKANGQTQRIVSIVLGVLLTLAVTAFITILAIHLKAVDGGWSSWGEWSTCSLTCGSGGKSRERSCTNPSPQYGGADCSGESEETVPCNTQGCPAVDGGWSSWGEWSTCSLTCGSGGKSRERSCTNPSPQNGGTDCSGESEETVPCNIQGCPAVDGGWSSWGEWSTCSLTCGSGGKSRERSCTNPSPKYGGADCSGESEETVPCNIQGCPAVDGGWSSWGEWSTCSLTCGSGGKSRERSCTNPSPQYGGADCSEESEETVPCNTQGCPVNGGWGPWGPWSTCSRPCGGGNKHISRSCNNPSPQNGGTDCGGPARVWMICNRQACTRK
ncbi:coadhesin-like [Saccostrea cucullata]|uniref:coadhesin-like n=1 Tax=Saccostrea cuccullata TaxID=36930 RepID=UPI002ED186C0